MVNGKPRKHCVGLSLFDEGSNYHVVGIVRQGDKAQPSISAEDFKQCFQRLWLNSLPKPKQIRYDCEGFFRSLDLVQWLEGYGIRLQPIAGEAPWQLDKHSKHLETIKENANLLATELPPETELEEVISATVAAKNELHTLHGFAPNQWAFGQNCDRLESFLQQGDQVVVQQQREKRVSFEDQLKRKNEARMIFLRQDAKLRIQRAANANVRRSQTFETGQLVYFFRRGRGHGSRYQSFWYGPAKVICTEKTGSVERNQGSGSIVWIVHGTTLYRCAPEQLRVVTHEIQNLSHMFGHAETPSEVLENAKQSQNYKDISQEVPGDEVENGDSSGSCLPPMVGRTPAQKSKVHRSADLSGTSSHRRQTSGSKASRHDSESHQASQEARRDFELFREFRKAERSDRAQEDGREPPDSAEPSGSATGRAHQDEPDPVESTRSQPSNPGRFDADVSEGGRPREPSSAARQPSGPRGDRLFDHGRSSARLRSRSRGQDQQSSLGSVLWNEAETSGEIYTIGDLLSSETLDFVSETESCPVGCALVPDEFKTVRDASMDSQSVSRGCFSWMDHAVVEKVDSSQAPIHFVAENSEMIEIILSVAPRDVHSQKRNGVHEWVLNQKPKKNAEVKWKTLTSDEKAEFRVAMPCEISSFLEREAIEIASRHGIDHAKLLNMRWVLTYKVVEDKEGNPVGRKAKARLIIRGFEDPNLLHLQRDSPTLSVQSRNLMLSLCAHNRWPIWAGDIKTAFLNGNKLPVEKQLFGDPPSEVREELGMKEHEVLRIQKVIYGLLHAPRAWMEKLNSVLRNQGWITSRLEPCIWRLFDGTGSLVGIIGCHVDDLLVSGSGFLFQQKVHELRNSFPFGSWQAAQDEHITFCGCELRQDVEFNIMLSQERYSLGICDINISQTRKQEPMAKATTEEKKQMRATLGALSWRATQTCPWLAASVSVLQGKQTDPIVEDLLETNKLIRMQRQFCDVSLKFSSRIEKPILVTYSDASWACRKDGSSQGGQITILTDQRFLEGKRCEYSLISWQSRKLARVARSSTSAEVQAASNATDNHEFLKQMILEWYNPQQILPSQVDQAMRMIPSVLILDCKNLFDSLCRIQSSGLQLEEKRTAIEVLSIRERTLCAGVQVRWVDSDQQLADGLSKPLKFDHILSMLQHGLISVTFDPLFVSAKKKRAAVRQKNTTDEKAVVSKGTQPTDAKKEEEGMQI